MTLAASGCCRTIKLCIAHTASARKKLQAARTVEDHADGIFEALETYKSVLGSYQISRRLTQAYRKELEPELSKVWSKTDLLEFAIRTQQFGAEIETSLNKWARRYCHDKTKD